MKQLTTLLSISLILLLSIATFPQIVEGEWECVYSTYDNSDNGTGYQTIALGVVGEDDFIALVNKGDGETCYLVGYIDADSANGRITDIPYATSGTNTPWIKGFSNVPLVDPNDLVGDLNTGLVYVANNDSANHHILTYKMEDNEVVSADYRMPVGDTYVWGIDVDGNGRVYVSTYDAETEMGKVFVFDAVDVDDTWESVTPTPNPIATIEVEDKGTLRDVTVNEDGTVVYISNYDAGKIYCYTGTPETGYFPNKGFNYMKLDGVYSEDSLGNPVLEYNAGPWGMDLMPGKNILFVAHDVDFHGGIGYSYGRIYALNPNTGNVIDMIDCAMWNYIQCDSSYYRTTTEEPTNASGYTSVYYVTTDDQNNIYSQSYYGWAADKWEFMGELPTIELKMAPGDQWNTNWECVWSTYDNSDNGTGYQTIAVGVLDVDDFVALVNKGDGSTCYLVGYVDADSANGRITDVPYATSGTNTPWIKGFSNIPLADPNDLVGDPNTGLVYVANNDSANHNILTYKIEDNVVVSADYRMPVGDTYVWGIDVDGEGHVYVTTIHPDEELGKVYIFDNVDNDLNWTSVTPEPNPVHELTIPDAGSIRDVTVSEDGKLIYVSNYEAGKIYAYVGSFEEGYTLNPAFDYEKLDGVYEKDSTGADVLVYPAGPWGLELMPETNILFSVYDVDFHTGDGYSYGRIYALNPNTGEIIDMIDCAYWNWVQCDSSYYRVTTEEPRNASGYTSVYNVASDSEFSLYSQSYFGWAVDKWEYNGELPVIPLTITGIERTDNTVPMEFALEQNFPNPFNPTTTIEFKLQKHSNITLGVYSVNGELITNLIAGTDFSAGTYQVTFDASKLASGIYFYTLTDGNQILTKKMVLLK